MIFKQTSVFAFSICLGTCCGGGGGCICVFRTQTSMFDRNIWLYTHDLHVWFLFVNLILKLQCCLETTCIQSSSFTQSHLDVECNTSGYVCFAVCQKFIGGGGNLTSWFAWVLAPDASQSHGCAQTTPNLQLLRRPEHGV